MAIRKELMERDGHLYEVEIIDENTIGSVKHISGQYNDLPPAGDVTYKEDTSSNINKNISTRYGGATSYIPYDQYGNKIVDLPSEEELKKLKEAQQGFLDTFENEDERYKYIGESPESESLQHTFKWQYEQELMKVLGDDFKGISDEAWKLTPIYNVLDSLKNDAYRFGWEFDPTHTGSRAALRKTIPESLQEVTGAAAYTFDNVLADWLVQNPLSILFGDKYGEPVVYGPMGNAEEVWEERSEDWAGGLSLLHGLTTDAILETGANEVLYDLIPALQRTVLIRTGKDESLGQTLRILGVELAHVAQLQGKEFDLDEFLDQGYQYYATKGYGGGEAIGDELPSGSMSQIQGYTGLKGALDVLGEEGPFHGHSKFYTDTTLKHPEYWAERGDIGYSDFHGYGIQQPIIDDLMESMFLTFKRDYQSGALDFNEYKQIIENLRESTTYGTDMINRYDTYILDEE
tara:strand:+ start:1051 stop:2433 length:1383 start_codon:yes stop_codon:yes gene_type:complete